MANYKRRVYKRHGGRLELLAFTKYHHSKQKLNNLPVLHNTGNTRHLSRITVQSIPYSTAEKAVYMYISTQLKVRVITRRSLLQSAEIIHICLEQPDKL